MSAIIPFEFNAPAIAQARHVSKINQEAITHSAGFPVLSIKGKAFTLIKGDERKRLTRVIDDEVVPLSSLQLAIVRANTKSRVYYKDGYVEGDSDGSKPTCFSNDGVVPDAQAEAPQAKKCQTCPHAVWGTKLASDGQGGKGTACSPNTRLAVVDPSYPGTPFLLRVPPASRANFSNAVKQVDQHGKDYNEVVFRVGFDPEAPSPKLTFTPKGLLAPDAQAAVTASYEDSTVRDIVGVVDTEPAAEAPAADPEFAAAVTAAAVVQKAQQPQAPVERPAAKPRAADDEGGLGDAIAQAVAEKPKAEKPKAEKPKAEKPKAEKPAVKAADGDADELLADLGSLLSGKDD